MITTIIALSSLCSITGMFTLIVNAAKEQNEMEQDNLTIDCYYNRQN